MTAPPIDSRTRIPDAALSLFARQGYAATSIKQIGSASRRDALVLCGYAVLTVVLATARFRKSVE